LAAGDTPRFALPLPAAIPGGGSSLATALRSIERFAAEVRPLLEREMGPLERIGLAEAA
jgi:hypothetical protein